LPNILPKEIRLPVAMTKKNLTQNKVTASGVCGSSKIFFFPLQNESKDYGIYGCSSRRVVTDTPRVEGVSFASMLPHGKGRKKKKKSQQVR
jgi:hypothetical protein